MVESSKVDFRRKLERLTIYTPGLIAGHLQNFGEDLRTLSTKDSEKVLNVLPRSNYRQIRLEMTQEEFYRPIRGQSGFAIFPALENYSHICNDIANICNGYFFLAEVTNIRNKWK